MSHKLKLAPAVKNLAKRESQSALDEVDGLSAVVVATIDGFDVASAMRTGEAARVAAMASSISAFSQVVSQEASLGRNKSVTIDTDDGFAIVYSVHRKDDALVVIAIAKGGAILAQVNYRLASLARTLEEA